MNGEEGTGSAVDRLADLLVQAELNRHGLVLSTRTETPGLMTGCCKCGWAWSGGWVPRTRENLDAIEAASRSHLDDVIAGRGWKGES